MFFVSFFFKVKTLDNFCALGKFTQKKLILLRECGIGLLAYQQISLTPNMIDAVY